jgi:hypothetical protein
MPSDNVAITAGSGTTIGTDEVSINSVLVQVQRVKPVWGADGTGTDPQISQPIPVQNTLETSQISNLGTIVTPKFASINVSSNGDNSIVAAVTSKKIRVLSYVIVADNAVAVMFRNGTTALMGAVSLAANGGIAAPFNPVGHFETSITTALNLNLASATGVRGHLTYAEIA